MSITVSSTARGAPKKAIETMIDLLLTDTQCTIEAAMRLSCQIMVASNCWHTWHKIGGGYRRAGTGNYVVCLDPRVYMVFTIYAVAFRVSASNKPFSAQVHPKQAMHVSGYCLSSTYFLHHKCMHLPTSVYHYVIGKVEFFGVLHV